MEPQMQIPSMTGPSPRLVHNMADLISIFEESEQPRSNWRIGTETEKFGVVGGAAEAIPYSGPVSVLAVIREPGGPHNCTQTRACLDFARARRST